MVKGEEKDFGRVAPWEACQVGWRLEREDIFLGRSGREVRVAWRFLFLVYWTIFFFLLFLLLF
jgi:hypothetical protein